MWNEILQKIDFINTPKQAVAQWSGDSDSIILVSDGINLVYLFQREGEKYYLRMTHAALRNEKELLAAISYRGYGSNGTANRLKDGFIKTIILVFLTHRNNQTN